MCVKPQTANLRKVSLKQFALLLQVLNAVKRAVIQLMLFGEIESQDHPKAGYCRLQFSYKTSRHSEIRSDSENPKQTCSIAMLALLPIHFGSVGR